MFERISNTKFLDLGLSVSESLRKIIDSFEVLGKEEKDL